MVNQFHHSFCGQLVFLFQMVREALASQLQATSPIAQAVSSSLPNQGVSNTLSPTTMSLQQQQQLTSPSLEVSYVTVQNLPIYTCCFGHFKSPDS